MQAEPLHAEEQLTGHVSLLALALSVVVLGKKQAAFTTRFLNCRLGLRFLLLLPTHWKNRVECGSPLRQISPEWCHQDQLEIYQDAAHHKIYGQAQTALEMALFAVPAAY